MRAIIAQNQEIAFVERPRPEISPSQCLIQVAYAGVNRADLLQIKGLYPPPEGASDILGLEFSGTVVKLGSEVKDISLGDKVCSIVASGAYADHLAVEASHLIHLTDNIDLKEAAAVPEAFITSYQSLIYIGEIQAGERILIHAGASGVGAAAIQIAKSCGCHVICTASKGKHDFCRSLGADECIDYKKVSFDQATSEIDLILDLVGGPYFQKNLKVLTTEGRMVMLGFLGGVNISETNIAAIITKRLKIEGSTLRARDDVYKSELISGLKKRFIFPDHFPFKTNVDREFDFENACDAHQYMAENKNKGKIVLRIHKK
ncbi:NAD(P)H-quinone oxidoreductase [Portibacter marinus]|uniref:NAD(P)H-quinone oxidoreductase n=1 Tax=Portibacter marinus TaxID=2898660 RepID=UPI001F30053C|nr:NAD(P)H-quinone oxidoreductase [Portibacter marinus]